MTHSHHTACACFLLVRCCPVCACVCVCARSAGASHPRGARVTPLISSHSSISARAARAASVPRCSAVAASSSHPLPLLADAALCRRPPLVLLPRSPLHALPARRPADSAARVCVVDCDEDRLAATSCMPFILSFLCPSFLDRRALLAAHLRCARHVSRWPLHGRCPQQWLCALNLLFISIHCDSCCGACY